MRGDFPRLPTCPECRTPIVWAITQANKRQALNPRPDPDGNVLAYRDGTGTWRARSLASTREIPAYGHEKTYMPHAATCPGPRQLRLPPPPPRTSAVTYSNVIPLRRRPR